ncbi:DUF4224 domain-containing protein [Burkholderia multivorans]|uniref:DUF4224 domain-containing protein n=1 Tax=Burkholderia multivorans TaxID=87883 RepID=UPI001C24462C|nr:DUF4224 domain-containing protein [Burkholderia multivorans]HDV6320857.1 DUF4224 domain-containing protein [Burkholderia multivorans]
MHILTNEELVRLAGGLKRGAAQIRWIERQLGFKPPRKIDGYPMITWEQINGSAQPVRRRTEPNWQVK